VHLEFDLPLMTLIDQGNNHRPLHFSFTSYMLMFLSLSCNVPYVFTDGDHQITDEVWQHGQHVGADFTCN
jgi:hypothetical protein